MASLFDEDDTRKSLEEMKRFPCTFNLKCTREVPMNRINTTKKKLVLELKMDEFSEEERIRMTNMLTWIYFVKGKKEKAAELNTEYLKKTKEENLTVLGNRVLIMWQTGDEIEAKRCLKKLEEMKERENFDTFMAEAKAEQAYCHSRLGGAYHLQRATELFNEALKINPDKTLWQYGIGLVFRRLTHSNVFSSSECTMNGNDITENAAHYLFLVAENNSADNLLRGKAYSQLVILRQIYPPCKFPQYDEQLFKRQNIHRLCNLALEYGDTSPTVLADCGRCFKKIDVDKALDLLCRSVALKPNSPAYHHLGRTYIYKATLISKGKLKERHVCTSSAGNHGLEFDRVKRQLFKTNSDAGGRGTNVPGEDITRKTSGHSESKKENIPGYLTCETVPTRSDKSSHELNDARTQNQEEWSPKKALETYVGSMSDDPLDISDELVKKGIEALELSIKFSCDENYPAMFDLGKVLKRCGDLVNALKQFNRAVYNSHSNSASPVTLISALEQAGMCYLELSNTSDDKDGYKKSGKEKLFAAVNIALDMASRFPELQGCEETIWAAGPTLKTILKDQIPSRTSTNELVHLLNVCKKYNEMNTVINEWLSSHSGDKVDEELIMYHLQSKLAIKSYEEALTFLMMEEEQANANSESWGNITLCDLRLQIRLVVTSERLKQGISSADLFQQVFALSCGSCKGNDRCNRKLTDISPSSSSRDLLIVFDEVELSNPQPCGLPTKIGRRITSNCKSVFGLDAVENLQGAWHYSDFQGTELSIQLKEMKKSRIVLLVVHGNDRSSEFQLLLDIVPYLKSNSTFLVLDTSNGESEIPQELKAMRCIKLNELGEISDVTTEGCSAGPEMAEEKNVLGNEFLMKLFYFIIGRDYHKDGIF